MKLQVFKHMQITDSNGNSQPQFDRFMGDFSQTLQCALTPEGYKLPTLTTAQIAQLDATKSPNVLLINSTTNELIVSLGGAFKTVQTS